MKGLKLIGELLAICFFALFFSACAGGGAVGTATRIVETAEPMTKPVSTREAGTPTATALTTAPALTTEEQRPDQTACTESVLRPFAFSADGSRLYGATDTSIAAADLGMMAGGQSIAVEPVYSATRMIHRAALSPDGKTLAVGLDDFTLELVSLGEEEPRAAWQAHTDRIDALVFSPAGDRLYSGSYDGWVRVWDLEGKPVGEFLPGGQRLATVTFEGPQKVWNLGDFSVAAVLIPGGAFSGANADFSADGRRVGLGLGGGPVSLWTVPEGNQVWSGGNYSLALSPDGRLLAYSDVDEAGNNSVVLRPVDGAEALQTLEDVPRMVWKLLFSPDGALLATADDVSVRLWRTDSGELLHEFKADCP